MPTADGVAKIEYGALCVQASTAIVVATQSVDYPILHASTVVAEANKVRTSPSGTAGYIKVGKGKWLVRAYARVAAAAGTPVIQLKLYAGAVGALAEVTNSTDELTTSGLLYVEKVVSILASGHAIQWCVSNETDANDINVTKGFFSVTGLDTSPLSPYRPS